MKKFLLVLILILPLISGNTKAQVFNPGFEDFNSDGSMRNWGNVMLTAISISLDSNGVPQYVDSLVIDGGTYSQLVPDAHSGNFALQLSNSYNYTTNEARAGSITADEDSIYSAWGNFEIVTTQTQPTELSFYYKYLSVNGDIGLATLQVYDSNFTQIGDVHVALIDNGNAYTYVSAPISFSVAGAQVQTYYLNFTTALPGTTPHLGSRLFIDDVSLNSPTALNEQQNKSAFSLYPNPANDKIILHGDIKIGTTAYIYNVTGQQISQTITVAPDGIIPVNNLPAGYYTIELRTIENTERLKFIISR